MKQCVEHDKVLQTFNWGGTGAENHCCPKVSTNGGSIAQSFEFWGKNVPTRRTFFNWLKFRGEGWLTLPFHDAIALCTPLCVCTENGMLLLWLFKFSIAVKRVVGYPCVLN